MPLLLSAIPLPTKLACVVLCLWAWGVPHCAAAEARSDETPETVTATPQFDTEIIPVLTRYGCNSGACHGAAIGRGGFKLSLFGSSPEMDYLAIVRELEGRRINLDQTDESLLLRKASESIEHGGGERFNDDSSAYRLLARWIETGAQRIRSRALTKVIVTPESVLIEKVGVSVEVKVDAIFDDGSRRDVTQWTVLASDDDESIVIDPERGLITPKLAGEHVVVARFLDQVIPIRVAVPLGTSEITLGRARASSNAVDRFVNKKLVELKIPPSPQVEDHEIARRIWLDLAGRLPSLAELDQYLQDQRPDKRSRLIDRLQDDPEFDTYWSFKWAALLSIDSKQIQPQGAKSFHNWLTKRFAEKASWQESTREMLTSSGDAFVNGPVNFLRSSNGPDGLAESATEVFLGVRLRCANCHDHPLDRWKQDDYHGLAAIFARLNRGRMVGDAERGEVTHPVTGMPAIARLPGTRNLSEDENWRQAFASWVTSDDNAYFAKAAVNRIWAQLMGRGLINPVDDLRATNPASHPELLNHLAETFIANGYRFRPIIHIICTSDAYGRDSKSLPNNQGDDIFYSRFLPRPLEAEVIANAIVDVTGVTINFGEEADPNLEATETNNGVSESNALKLTDNRTASLTLDILGRCDRSESCELAPAGSGSLAQVLHFLNGDLLNDRLMSSDGNLADWLAELPDDQKLLQTLYNVTLSRPLRPPERRYWKQQLESSRQSSTEWPSNRLRHEFFADVLWGLVTSETFLHNH